MKLIRSYILTFGIFHTFLAFVPSILARSIIDPVLHLAIILAMGVLSISCLQLDHVLIYAGLGVWCVLSALGETANLIAWNIPNVEAAYLLNLFFAALDLIQAICLFSSIKNYGEIHRLLRRGRGSGDAVSTHRRL